MGRMDDRSVIVTGAGRGIGRAIAERLAAEGAAVAVTDVDEDTATGTAAEIGGKAVGIHADVTDPGSVRAMVQRAREEFGRIDGLVNNAGWDKIGPFVDSDPADWDRIIRINLYGVLHTSQAVVPVMIAQGGGTVVNIASDAARVGSSGEAVYSAAKGGVISFTKTLAREVARHGINANCVCPGPTDTPLFSSLFEGNDRLRDALVKAIPFRRLARPDDLAATVAFFASPDATYLTGQTVSVSGGLSMV
ncbi:3-oxoacyl-ACP reductase FabG [Pseudonocardia sp. C8]|uniref:SDR family NAD(P)-dependent oxidoreductase n=1 Tax=Pseudonocardia sp. C8 TaxID=2762759 RepID=UPI0016428660|nr:3-oxoacyl-ACP reductase family protein [Pseudonocardia sp. C8]MBC3193044.1 3-oxoacyl-ACP reductase FabG [Pseudonocardia sp. C8]